VVAAIDEAAVAVAAEEPVAAAFDAADEEA